MAQAAHAVVGLTTSPRPPKTPPSTARDEQSAGEQDGEQPLAAGVHSHMDEVALLVSKIGSSWGPFKREKNQARASQAVAAIENMRKTMVKHVEKLGSLEQQCAELETLRAKSAAQTETITKLKEQLRERDREEKEIKASKEAEVSTMLTKVEAVAGGPKRYLKLDPAKEEALLQQRIDTLLRDHEKLKAEHEKLQGTKADMAKRIKELQDKVRDENDVKEREMRRVNAEFKKASDAKDAAVAAVRAEGAEQLAVKNREFKALQKRYDTVKTELDTIRSREQAGKKDTEQASSALTKAQQDAKMALKKAADARAERDILAQQMALAREELAMVAAEYKQTLKLCKDHASNAASAYVKADKGPWPRQALTVRGCCVLHNASCGKVDVTKVDAHEYASVKDLEGLLSEGFVLCKDCRATGF